MSDFSWRARVYWEDTDAGGVVYYADYLRFLERARTEWLRARGIDQSRLRDETGVVLVVRSVTADFLAPARLDDELLISVEIDRIGAATLRMNQSIDRTSNEIAKDDRLLEAQLTAACLDARSWRPRRLPPVLREAIASELT